MGFFDRNRAEAVALGIDPARIPPGQYRTERWPVLHEGPVPAVDLASWRLRVWGLVEQELRLSYDDLVALGEVELTTDLHCVTKWSRFDTLWRGVPIAAVLDAAGVRPSATHTLTHAPHAYATNLPLADLLAPGSLVATSVDGGPIPPEHGGPVRTLVPHLYLWKSVKWVTGIQVLDHDVPGYWEARGYHDRGDPFQEQRYR
ncbi:MAG: sulfite oxidase-like oxidoreductase [Actinobacteria bacterium]|nr:sulfite oxidase-like oxidoreductase [Actinomycetota bacterium]